VSTSMITATARHEGGSSTLTQDTIERATAQAARAAAERAAMVAAALDPEAFRAERAQIIAEHEATIARLTQEYVAATA
jgi:hypothetical protein